MCKKIIIIQIKTSVQALLYRHLSNFSLTSATILKPSRGWTPCFGHLVLFINQLKGLEIRHSLKKLTFFKML